MLLLLLALLSAPAAAYQVRRHSLPHHSLTPSLAPPVLCVCVCVAAPGEPGPAGVCGGLRAARPQALGRRAVGAHLQARALLLGGHHRQRRGHAQPLRLPLGE
jgi:hypothetical protein